MLPHLYQKISQDLRRESRSANHAPPGRIPICLDVVAWATERNGQKNYKIAVRLCDRQTVAFLIQGSEALALKGGPLLYSGKNDP